MFFSKKKVPEATGKQRQRKGNSSVDSVLDPSTGFIRTYDEFADSSSLEAELQALAGDIAITPVQTELDGDDDETLERELTLLMRNVEPKKEENIRKKNERETATASMSDTEDDEEVDENDPDLLKELEELNQPSVIITDNKDIKPPTTTISEKIEVPEKAEATDTQVQILKKRLEMYQTAENTAKVKNEPSRARRFNRGVKTLEKLIKQSEAGVIIPMDDIPPLLSVPATSQIDESKELNEEPKEPLKEPTNEEYGMEKPLKQPTNIDQNLIAIKPETHEVSLLMNKLKTRLELYEAAEKIAKECNETAKARRFARGKATLQRLIKQAENNENVLETDMPPEITLNIAKGQVTAAPITNPELPVTAAPIANPDLPVTAAPIANPDLPVTLLIEESKQATDSETLLLRNRERYKAMAIACKQENNMIEALKYVKFVKQLDQELDKLKRGEQIDLSQIICLEEHTHKSETSLVGSLQRRLEYFQRMYTEAEGHQRRNEARKYREIVTMYNSAIRTLNRNGSVDLRRLPLPPGESLEQ